MTAPRQSPGGKAGGPAESSATAGSRSMMPAPHDAEALAGQLDSAMTALRDPHTAEADVRRAAELEQLAVLTLATASSDYRRQVTARTRPATAQILRQDLAAARLLRELTSPQRSLPHWRITDPPPAPRLLRYYKQAQARTGVPWTYLAAIHLVETRTGRIRGTSSAGAQGPMQFLPSTWELYGAGGDIDDPHDAILAAARLLRSNGAPGDLAGALWHFNPSQNYVRAVSTYARTMQRRPSAYRGYWHWRVLYRHARGTYVLPVGYPRTRAELVLTR